MPFAPIILDTYANKYLYSSHSTSSPFMALSFKTITEVGYKDLTAVHAGDKTCRAQILKKKL